MNDATPRKTEEEERESRLVYHLQRILETETARIRTEIESEFKLSIQQEHLDMLRDSGEKDEAFREAVLNNIRIQNLLLEQIRSIFGG